MRAQAEAANFDARRQANRALDALDLEVHAAAALYVVDSSIAQALTVHEQHYRHKGAHEHTDHYERTDQNLVHDCISSGGLFSFKTRATTPFSSELAKSPRGTRMVARERR